MNIKAIDFQGTGNFYYGDIYSFAKSYKMAFDLICEKRRGLIKSQKLTEESKPLALLLLVGYVNLSLSCELFLKALLLKTKSIKIKGHEFNNLFEKLDSNIKVKIREMVTSLYDDKKYPLNFDKEIIDNANAFEKIRYFYEGDIHFNVKFIKILVDVLDSIYKEC